MEEGPSSLSTLVVSSPGRTLSLLHKRRSSAFASSSNSAFPVHDKHTRTDAGFTGDDGRPKPLEVYRIVKSITTVIATVIYLVWAYTPKLWLRSLGITYYPSKYWALAVPSFVIVSVFLMMVLYLGFEFLSDASAIFTQCNMMNIAVNLAHSLRQRELQKPIYPISDVGINQINHLMFGNICKSVGDGLLYIAMHRHPYALDHKSPIQSPNDRPKTIILFSILICVWRPNFTFF